MSAAADATFDTGLSRADLDPERPRPILTPWGTMALYRVGTAIYAVQAFCPHLDGPLFEGTLSGDTITCPWHRWCYDLATGERVDELRPLASEPLVRCDVSFGPNGTVVLARPARAIRPMM